MGPGEHNMIKTRRPLRHKDLLSPWGLQTLTDNHQINFPGLRNIGFFSLQNSPREGFLFVFTTDECFSTTNSRAKPQAPPWFLQNPAPPRAPSQPFIPQRAQGAPCTLRGPPPTLLVDAGPCPPSQAPTYKRTLAATIINTVIKK